MRKALVPFIVLAAAGTVVLAQGGRFGPGHGFGPGGGFGPPMGGRGPCGDGGRLPLRELDLTDAQKAQVDALRDETRKVMDPLHEKVGELHGRLQELLDAPSPDATQIGQQMIAIREAHDAIEAARAQHDAKLDAILTPEQRQKLASLRDERGGPRHERRPLRKGGEL
jgi:Spy/CpxP family protein refolding chaperone